MQVIRSTSLDPFENLAREDALLEQGVDAVRLFLWRSADAVVLGRNQNPWLECDVAALQVGGGLLARRVSGGGAVYQDRGNLNYAVILPRAAYREGEIMETFCAGLAGLGVRGRRLGKSSVAVGERKVSGTAFCYRKRHVLHHGTLLVKTDLSRMRSLLRPIDLGIESRAVRSEPVPVTNLAEQVPSVTIDRAAAALIGGFEARFGRVAEEVDADQLSPPDSERFVRPDWRFDRSPRFVARRELGQGRVMVDIHRGIVQSSTLKDLVGRPFRPQEWRNLIPDAAWTSWIDGFGQV